MPSPFSDELISAYLDGELTDEERAHVEKQLAKDVELRRMCDELRTLQLTLQSIPASDPSEDLADRVLRRAERRMLSGTDDEPAAAKPAPEPVSPVEVAPTDATEVAQRNWRLAAGVVVSVAALLMVAFMLVDPASWQPQSRDVAQAVGESAPAQSAEDSESSRTEPLVAFGVELEEEQGVAAGALPANDELQERSAGTQESGVAPGSVNDGVADLSERSMRERKAGWSGLVADGPPASESRPVTTDAPRAVTLGSSSPKLPAVERDKMRGYGMPGYGGGAGVSPSGGGGSATRGGAMSGYGPSTPQGNSRRGLEYRLAPVQQPGPLNLPARQKHGEAQLGRPASAANTDLLVRQLETDQSLLVQVSVPRNLEARFLYSTDKQDQNASEIPAGLEPLIGEVGATNVEYFDRSQRTLERFRKPQNQNPDRLFLVEGTRNEVQESLQRLVSRRDIQVRHVTPDAWRRLTQLRAEGATSLRRSATPQDPSAEPASDFATEPERGHRAKLEGEPSEEKGKLGLADDNRAEQRDFRAPGVPNSGGQRPDGDTAMMSGSRGITNKPGAKPERDMGSSDQLGQTLAEESRTGGAIAGDPKSGASPESAEATESEAIAGKKKASRDTTPPTKGRPERDPVKSPEWESPFYVPQIVKQEPQTAVVIHILFRIKPDLATASEAVPSPAGKDE